MKRLNKNKILEDFWEGNTSLEEEAFLKSQNNFGITEKAYFSFLQKKEIVPSNLEDTIWSSITRKEKISKRLLVRWAVAATVVTAIGLVSLLGMKQRNSKLEKQFALIEQTLNHVSNELETSNANEVIYEDNFIVIVADN